MKIVRTDILLVRLPFLVPISHALASRNYSDNIFVLTWSESGKLGVGEAAPRPYVTSETAENAFLALAERMANIWLGREISGPEELRQCFSDCEEWYSDEDSRRLAARCALELALVDLAGHEWSLPAFEIFGFNRSSLKETHYCGVIPYGDYEFTRKLVEFYQHRFGKIRSFKVKGSGDWNEDGKRIVDIRAITGPFPQIRLDLNCSLTEDNAASYFHNAHLAGVEIIEEPLGARSWKVLSRLRKTFPVKVELDESICSIEDGCRAIENEAVDIISLRVSKNGGISNAFQLFNLAENAGLRCKVGAQVGESGLLDAAGRQLACMIAADETESSFPGLLLLAPLNEYVPRIEIDGRGVPLVGPGLGVELPIEFLETSALKTAHLQEIGARRSSVAEKNSHSQKSIEHDGPRPIQSSLSINWCDREGDKTLSTTNDRSVSEVFTVAMSDGYLIHHRIWGCPKSERAVLILHGGMSNSSWFGPLAEALLGCGDLLVVGVDRRGSGLNTERRGDLPSRLVACQDISETIRCLKDHCHLRHIHLAGWCWGALPAILVAAENKNLSSLILAAPALQLRKEFIAKMWNTLASLSPTMGLTEASIPLPITERDFTTVSKWNEFIDKDETRVRLVTPRFWKAHQEMLALLPRALQEMKIPQLLILAKRDQTVDNDATQVALESWNATTIAIDSHHGIHFEKAQEEAKAIWNFVQNVEGIALER